MDPLTIATLLMPLVTQFVIPGVEKLLGKKTSPADTATGDAKLNAAITLIKQFAAAKGLTITDDQAKALAQAGVDILQPLGLGSFSQTGVLTSAPSMAGTFPVTFTGTVKIGG